MDSGLRLNRVALMVMTLAVGLGLAGCAAPIASDGVKADTHSERLAISTVVADEPDYQWHALRFRWSWDQQSDPDWGLDALAADQLLAPLLRLYRGALPLWRFHRRAGRDGAGHQFSLLVFTDSATFQDMRAAVLQHRLIPALAEAGVLKEFVATENAYQPRTGVAASSDPAWPENLQRQWPAYIMGVSATWLGLVSEAAQQSPGSSVEGLLQHYREVQAAVSGVWHEQGQHAFLHHANALFGYQPLMIRQPWRF